jgi:ribosomal protein L7/L12
MAAKLTKLTIRVPAETAERLKFLAHDTCESVSHVAAIMLAKALHKPAPPKAYGRTVGGVYLTPEVLGVINVHKLNGNKIMAVKAIREQAHQETGKDLGLYEAKKIADELWARNDR